jgi:hypothetical protein
MQLTLLVVEDNSSLWVHDMTSPDEIDSRSDTGDAAPPVHHTQVGGSMVDGRVV